MTKKILDRYSRTPDNKLMIEIDVGRIEDLYNEFDRHAPYVKKELDEDLVEYLIDSVREIGKEDFVIQFRLAESPDASLMSRIKTSIHNYFLYLIELEYRELACMRRNSLIFFLIGIVILSLSVWINQKIEADATVIVRVLSEGLTVAAWVSLWNAIATFLINWAPHRQHIKMFECISKADILFHETRLESNQ